MISDNMNEESLPLSDFVELPTTVDFQAINSDRFRAYISDKPYIRLGTELANNYVVGYTNEKNIQKIFTDLGSDFVTFYPKILSPLGSKANDAAGITRVLEQPFLDLTGRGVIIGFIDTGIDYTAPSFRYEDGSTKILSIWDQTANGERTDGIYYGAVYTGDKINEALLSENPYSIVPETDESGHGTFLASAAAGNEKGEYAGAAPGAGIIAVKLRRARQYYIDQYLLPADEPELYEATDFILGVKYILDAAYARNMPAVICIGMGSNSVAHDGNTLLEDYISFAAQRAGITFVTAAGNEANARHHTQGRIPENDTVETISINVGRQGESFTVYIFGPAFDKLSLGIVSPTGEVIPRAGHDGLSKILQGRQQQYHRRLSLRDGGHMGDQALRRFHSQRRVLGVASAARSGGRIRGIPEASAGIHDRIPRHGDARHNLRCIQLGRQQPVCLVLMGADKTAETRARFCCSRSGRKGRHTGRLRLHDGHKRGGGGSLRSGGSADGVGHSAEQSAGDGRGPCPQSSDKRLYPGGKPGIPERQMGLRQAQSVRLISRDNRKQHQFSDKLIP